MCRNEIVLPVVPAMHAPLVSLHGRAVAVQFVMMQSAPCDCTRASIVTICHAFATLNLMSRLVARFMPFTMGQLAAFESFRHAIS